MNFFAKLTGQNQAVELLTAAVRQQRIAPAYLFAGPAGVGRSLAAQCFIEQLFCSQPSLKQRQHDVAAIQHRLRQRNHPDLLWVQPTYLHQGQRLSLDAATAAGLKRKAPPVIRIEQIREVTKFLSQPPLEASRSVVVLAQAETMAEAAANALLKTLEEPGQATLILIAPATQALLPTLVSRCQRIPFYRLATDAMTKVLQQNGYEEILYQQETALNNSVVLQIAQGSPGEAIAAWRQLQAIPVELLENLRQLPKSLGDALDLARQIDKTLDTEAQLWLLKYLQHFYWQQCLAGTELNPQRLASMQHLEQARQYLISYAQPRLVWEVALLAIRQEAEGQEGMGETYQFLR